MYFVFVAVGSIKLARGLPRKELTQSTARNFKFWRVTMRHTSKVCYISKAKQAYKEKMTNHI
jgi:hypothetical protein